MEKVVRQRKSIRLKGYDYSSPGAYFVTICTTAREDLFGRIKLGEMQENEFASIVRACWQALPEHYMNVEMDAFVVMPNHVHGIVVITDKFPRVGADLRSAPTSAPTGFKRHGLPEIIRASKSFSARRINESRQTPGAPVWQRNYYEHIIRTNSSLDRIREYIDNNPRQWEFDRENKNRTAANRSDEWLKESRRNPISERRRG